MQKPYDREEYNRAINDCYPELASAREANTKGDEKKVVHHFSEVIKILSKFVPPIDLQPHDKD